MKLEPSELHLTMVQQVDHMRPAHLKPGVDVGIEVRDENSITVSIPAQDVRVVIEYQPGPDLYAVEILRDGEVTAHEGIYCDQLGELVFGDEAKQWTQPMVQISDDDGETWTVIA